MEYQRQVTINASLEKTYLFIKEVKNLPIWTRFFKRCISCNNGIGEMETPIGKSFTSILEERVHSSIKLQICSKFMQHQEQALIVIEEEAFRTKVIFHLKVPTIIQEAQQQNMVKNLEEELCCLKQHLECTYG